MAVGPIRRDEASAPFFDGTARGELRIRRCTACGHAAAPQARQCPRCRSSDLAWATATGTATVVSWAVVHGRPAADGTPARTVVGIVELDEGPWLHARIAADPDALAVGAALRARFEAAEGGEAIPVFEPA